MIKYFSSADVYLISGIWLVSFEHIYTGIFCIGFALVDAYVCALEDVKKDMK